MDYRMVGHNISECRKNKKLTQEALSELLDITPQYLSLIEHGKRFINIELIIRIGAALNVSVDRLLLGNQYCTEAYGNAFSDIFSDCGEYEKKVIVAAAERLKEVLIENDGLK